MTMRVPSSNQINVTFLCAGWLAGWISCLSVCVSVYFLSLFKQLFVLFYFSYSVYLYGFNFYIHLYVFVSLSAIVCVRVYVRICMYVCMCVCVRVMLSTNNTNDNNNWIWRQTGIFSTYFCLSLASTLLMGEKMYIYNSSFPFEQGRRCTSHLMARRKNGADQDLHVPWPTTRRKPPHYEPVLRGPRWVEYQSGTRM